MRISPNLLVISAIFALSCTSGQSAELTMVQLEPTKDNSIIKNVAASLKSNKKTTLPAKQSTLDQILRDSQNGKVATLSSEESMALSSISTQAKVYTENPNRKVNSFFMRLFGG